VKRYRYAPSDLEPISVQDLLYREEYVSEKSSQKIGLKSQTSTLGIFPQCIQLHRKMGVVPTLCNKTHFLEARLYKRFPSRPNHIFDPLECIVRAWTHDTTSLLAVFDLLPCITFALTHGTTSLQPDFDPLRCIIRVLTHGTTSLQPDFDPPRCITFALTHGTTSLQSDFDPPRCIIRALTHCTTSLRGDLTHSDVSSALLLAA
jgi:hypothetical protein